jgi:hypothetical protein
MLKKQALVTEGPNTIRLNNLKQAGFVSGTYLLKVSGNKEAKTFKFIVQY